MINSILADIVGLTSAMIVIIAYVFVFALVIICLVRVSRYFLTAGKEQKLMRIEIGKLAEEMHQLRQELKSNEKDTSVTKTE